MARLLLGAPGPRGTTRVDDFDLRAARAASALDAEMPFGFSEDQRSIADRTAHRDGRVGVGRDEDVQLHQRKLMATAARSVTPAALWPAVAESTRAFTTSAFRAMMVPC